ncbi:VOC family protein [Mesorhizobium sp. L48C026A00]|uniref:VOC family protein n=1 Tax=Mesorhizobium sp. L48C026A00 TaxID=1287182 RepID=UPI00358F947B
MLGLPAPRRWGPFQWSRPTTTPISTIWIPRRRSCASITPFWSTTPNSNRYSTASANGTCLTGLTPANESRGETNDHDGGRGLYFEDPNGHLLEIITRPYGSGGWNP